MSGVLQFENNSIRKGIKEYVRPKMRRLLIPYIGFEIINLFFSIFIIPVAHNLVDIRAAIISILTCINSNLYQGISGRLWFLPCIFISDIFFYFIMRCSKKIRCINNIILCAVVLNLFVSYETTKLNYRLPFTIDIAFMATVFILLGYLFGSQIKRCMYGEWNVSKFILMIGAGLILMFCIKYNTPYYMYINDYGVFSLGFLGAISGCILFLLGGRLIFTFICKYTKYMRMYIDWLGINSLLFFPIHLEILFFVEKVNRMIGISNWFVNAIMVALICIPVINIIRERMPWLAGISS